MSAVSRRRERRRSGMRNGIRYFCLILLTCLPLLAGSPLPAQTPSLIVTLPDTTLQSGQSAWLPIYMLNYDDAIAGVQFTMVLRDPQLAAFDLGGPYFDTTGTLLSGWELVDGYDTSGIGASLTLYGLANTLPDNHVYTPPIPAYGGGALKPLIRVPVRAMGIPDSSETSTALEFDGLLEFATPDAQLVGIVTELIIDTLYLRCVERIDDSCVSWNEVDPHQSGYDTVVVDSTRIGYIDSTVVVGRDGSVTVLQAMSCDITGDAAVTLTDLTCLVQFLFNQNRPPACLYYGNCNFADPDVLNLSDVTGLVRYLFHDGPPPQ